MLCRMMVHMTFTKGTILDELSGRVTGIGAVGHTVRGWMSLNQTKSLTLGSICSPFMLIITFGPNTHADCGSILRSGPNCKPHWDTAVFRHRLDAVHIHFLYRRKSQNSFSRKLHVRNPPPLTAWFTHLMKSCFSWWAFSHVKKHFLYVGYEWMLKIYGTD